MDHQSDEALVHLLKSGHAQPHAELYRRYCDGIFAYCAKILSRTEDAEDAMQEAFVNMGTQISSLTNKDTRQPLRIQSSVGLQPDSLNYMVSEPPQLVFRPERTLDKYRGKLTGKVAIIARTWPGGMTTDRYYTSIAYREAVKTILGKQFAHVSGYVLFDRLDVVVDIMYPLFAAALCAFTFPFAKAADEARRLEGHQADT